VATITKPGETTLDAFVVVLNEEGQHALWPAESDVPSGWRRASPVVPASEALAAIDDAWPDVTPASVSAGRPPGPAAGPFVHEAFTGQAARHPDAAAVIAGRSRLTYRELEESASRLAGYLSEAGVAPETLVGVCLDRGADMILAILAIMKAGGGYLALDPSLPPDRLAQVCAQVRPAMVITDRAAPFPGAGARLLRLSDLAADLERRRPVAPAARPGPDNTCYVIYTSGSTGDPKAVAVSYGSLASVIGSIAEEYQIGEHDRVAQVASPAFDTSLEQVLVALTRGAALMLPPPGTMAPSELLRGIGRKRITIIDLTPAYWHQVLAHTEPGDERLRSVRLMITGGEVADPADCRAALRAAPWARLLNAYGLTETTITSALCDVGAWLSGASQESIVPVGKPVGDARIMVMDERLRPVPAGETGEVCIGGPGVARGYLGRPGLTGQRFVPDAGGAPGARMYRTGDVGRWAADGNLEVSGRMDRQLKVRGFRVEPAEIESVLAGHPDVGQVSVVAGTRGSGDSRLVAYYTPSRGAASGSAGYHPPAISLRRYLLDRLPGYMIPAAFVPRQHLPSAPGDGSGPDNEDRPARPATAGERYTPAQAGLSALWARLLRREHVGLDDDFFSLGGNSLLAAEMLANTCALFGVSADSVRPLTRSLLRDPTLRGFSAAVRDARDGKLSSAGDQPEADFAREAQLDLVIERAGAPWRPRPDWRDPREVLLTGATGFLGTHLLSELLATTSARIWCLVRATDEADARRRIARTSARYELGAPPADRVVPLPGDLAEPWLGLSDVAFRDLARGIDIIYHAGALVNFIYPYQELRAANVAGTREVVRLAGLYRGIPVHYVSTTAVLAGLGVAGVREVTEETALAWPERLRMGYVETKYVAEELVRAAGRAGLPVAVYRPLDIVGSVAAGMWSTSTEMAAMIRFITDTGLAPDVDLPLDFVPADVCAATIRHISVSQEATGRTYHLASPKQAPLSSLVDRLRDQGYPVSRIPFADWVSELAREAARDPSHPMAAFLPLFVDRDSASGLTVAEMYLEHVFPAYSRTNTEQALRGTDIAFPPVNGQLIGRNLGRLKETGYLPAPPGHSVRPPEERRAADAC
jgi:amino acid adenylation domain-containing protein/thioester reductase-like protein